MHTVCPGRSANRVSLLPVEGLRPHTRDDRRRLIDELIELHRRHLADDLLGLATQGSYARGGDSAYSDIELVAFLRTVPGTANWADCVQIWQGMLVDIIWTTPAEYIARVKEITPQWHLAGSDHLGALINPSLIAEVNAHEPANRAVRCIEQAQRQWPVVQEAAGKVLNALSRGDVASVGRLLFALLDAVLAVLAFLNERPYASPSTALVEAQALPKRPRGFEAVVALATDGAYADVSRTRQAVVDMFTGLEELFRDEGIALYESELVLRPVPSS